MDTALFCACFHPIMRRINGFQGNSDPCPLLQVTYFDKCVVIIFHMTNKSCHCVMLNSFPTTPQYCQGFFFFFGTQYTLQLLCICHQRTRSSCKIILTICFKAVSCDVLPNDYVYFLSSTISQHKALVTWPRLDYR